MQDQTELPFALMLDCARDALILTSIDGLIIFANKATKDIFLYSDEDLTRLSVDVLIAPAEQNAFRSFHAAFRLDPDDDRIEVSVISSDGIEFPAEICLAHIDYRDCRYLSVTIIDLSETRELEEQQRNYIRSAQALVDSEAFTQSILNSLPSQIAVVDYDGTLIAVNKAWEDFARENGVTTLERITTGSNYLDTCRNAEAAGDEISSKALSGMLAVLEGRETIFEQRYPCHSPTEERWFMLRVSRFESDKPKIVTTHENITNIVKAEKAIRYSEANLHAIIENTKAHIYSIDREYRYLIFNTTLSNKLFDLYGQKARQGDNVFEFLEKLAPEEALEWKAHYDDAFTGRSVHFTREFHFDGFSAHTSFWLNPIRENDKVIGLACFALDTTEQKEAEAKIKSLNESLEEKVRVRTAELLAANKELETFSYSISHDLQSPLHLLSMFSGILQSEYSEQLDKDGRNCVGIINDSAKMMSGMIRDLLKFSQVVTEPLQKRVVNMKDKVHSVIQEARLGEQYSKAAIHVHDLRPACCDPSLMRQVWANLISNALKYSSKKDKPAVDIGMVRSGDEDAYCVRDNGAGFDMRYADKLFNVFQRIHKDEDFEGTGVGLATVHRIITRHGGRIWAESKPGEGATFFFTLPPA